MSQSSLFPLGEPKVPSWIVQDLEKNFPLQGALQAKDFNEVQFLKGVHHVIEYLRSRSDKPNE